ncbi:HAD-IIIC family phosphatase [Sphingomonas baiyangensis]|uniref:HAD-IIIC family phosphatase n=1 Tax=Sphingomonas baiyangensis TaxID=2572576 RepID=A0A4U1L280_9SPHN|nr:HAD-IIIC family phosphatase [Sphingomonas baiyangensis]TKD50320.1 HAD-IIIC family phosphatase [Sphingomonas baiyangensis]
MPRIVIDLDDTITQDRSSAEYREKLPNLDVVEKLREYRAQGFEIVIHSARNMRSFAGAIGRINVHTLPIVLEWLARHDVPFDEVIMGKPWCGEGGFYVDDKTVRPDEFARLSLDEIYALVGSAAPGDAP